MFFLYTVSASAEEGVRLTIGAERLAEYSHLIEGRRVGVLANHTSRVGSTYLVDTLLSCGVDVMVIFTPSDGFRGEGTPSGRDSHLGIAIKTLHSAPKANDIFGCDVVLCDLQDGGVRGSAVEALYRTMGVCADLEIPFVVLDRPLANGRVTDGAIPEQRYCTACQMPPLPLLYGMTLGEVARMINGEGWLSGGRKCPLTVVPAVGWSGEVSTTPASIVARGVASCVIITNERGEIDLSGIVGAYSESENKEEFFVGEEFNRLLGVSYAKEMVEQGYTASEIHTMWRPDIERFFALRTQYLIYK